MVNPGDNTLDLITLDASSLNVSRSLFHNTVQTGFDAPRRITNPTFASRASNTCSRAGNLPRSEGGFSFMLDDFMSLSLIIQSSNGAKDNSPGQAQCRPG